MPRGEIWESGRPCYGGTGLENGRDLTRTERGQSGRITGISVCVRATESPSRLHIDRGTGDSTGVQLRDWK